MLEIIKSKNNWNASLSEFDVYDTYHTFDYHMITKSKGETPILIKYTDDGAVIGIPLLIRTIENTHYKDATSVYGYCGPLSKGIDDGFDNSLFMEALTNFFTKNRIISVFSRLNPYIPYQNNILNGLGEVFEIGKVVNIDLKLDKITQRKNYHRRLKNQINKSRKNCSILKADDMQGVTSFINIYLENMIRVKAKRSYYFNKDYYFNLFECNDFETEIFLAKDNVSDTIIAGAMFFKKNDIVQYHLSGTKSDFLHLMPTKLIIDEMRITATDEGYKILNLGGGLGASGKDSLFRFKSSFSNDHRRFCLWKFIINREAYDNICNKNKIVNRDSSFFPLYRLEERP